jgi:hypothetical protein
MSKKQNWLEEHRSDIYGATRWYKTFKLQLLTGITV